MEILNRKANYDYFIEETYESGIVLTGTEIKSIRNGSANLKDSYAIIKKDEIFLLNMHISFYKEGDRLNHQETRTRKLLLHKKQILKLKEKTDQEGYTLVPLKLYFKENRVKILLGIGKGKKNYDKRQTIKEKDIKMNIARESKYQIK